MLSVASCHAVIHKFWSKNTKINNYEYSFGLMHAFLKKLKNSIPSMLGLEWKDSFNFLAYLVRNGLCIMVLSMSPINCRLTAD